MAYCHLKYHRRCKVGRGCVFRADLTTLSQSDLADAFPGEKVRRRHGTRIFFGEMDETAAASETGQRSDVEFRMEQ